jgi:hypothetical protein
MCGSTSAQNNLQQEQADFYQQGMQQQATEYGEDQSILQQMQSTLTPIFQAGPNQYGFNASEQNALNTSATEGGASSYAQASKALNEQQAAEGGTSYLPGGAQTEAKEQLAASAAAQQAQAKTQITEAGYQQGYNQWQAAAQGLGETSSQLNPEGGENAATSAGEAAGTTANQIAQENNSWLAPVLGAAGAIGTGIVGANPGGVFD